MNRLGNYLYSLGRFNRPPQAIVSEARVERLEDMDEVTCPDGSVVDMRALLRDQSRAEAALSHLAPFLGGFVSRLRFIYTFEVETQATDGYNVFVNPQFTANMDFTGKVFVMAHEIMHCLLNHMRREKEAGMTDHYRANIAADYEVNITLTEMGLCKFDTVKDLGGYIDKKYSGWAFEKIYPTVQSQKNNNMQGQQNPSQNGQQGQQQQGGNQQGQQSSSGQQQQGGGQGQQQQGGSQGGSGQSGAGQGQQQGQGAQSGGGQGSQSSGQASQSGQAGSSRELQNTPQTPGGYISRREGDKIAQRAGYDPEGPKSDEATAKQWEDAAQREIQRQKSMGKSSAGKLDPLISKLKELYAVVADWKKELRMVVGQSINPANTRTAYVNRNTLIGQDRLARTDKDAYDSPNYIMAFIDVSGSMNQDAIAIALDNAYAAASAKNPFIRLVVVCFDTSILALKEYKNLQEYRRNPLRVSPGGGTDVRCCFNLLRKGSPESRKYPGFVGNKPDLIMLFTDGYLAQYPRDTRTMGWLCWVIMDNPSFELEKKDRQTLCIRVRTSDIK